MLIIFYRKNEFENDFKERSKDSGLSLAFRSMQNYFT